MKITDPIRYVGLWSPGNGSSVTWRDDAEAFETIDQAGSILLARYHNTRWGPQQTLKVEWDLDGSVARYIETQRLDTPGTSDQCSIILLPVTSNYHGESLLRTVEAGSYSHILEIGPKGGLKVTRA